VIRRATHCPLQAHKGINQSINQSVGKLFEGTPLPVKEIILALNPLNHSV